MKICLCVKPDLAESKDGYAYCKSCDNWFNSGLWKKHWAGKVESAIEKNKIGRNDPCPCKSGKKYKKCCLKDVPQYRRWIKRNSSPTVDEIDTMLTEQSKNEKEGNNEAQKEGHSNSDTNQQSKCDNQDS